MRRLFSVIIRSGILSSIRVSPTLDSFRKHLKIQLFTLWLTTANPAPLIRLHLNDLRRFIYVYLRTYLIADIGTQKSFVVDVAQNKNYN